MMLVWAVLDLGAQDVKFTASVDRNPVQVGQAFNVKFTIENSRGDIRPPRFDDFDVIFGPSTSSSFQMVNGRQSYTMTLSYTLRARAVGTYTIGSARAQIGNNQLASEPIEVEVVKSASGATATPGAKQAPSRTQAAQKDVMVRTLISKRKVYQGEPLVVTFELLSRGGNIELSSTNIPDLDGFWAEDIKSGQTSWEREYEYINGVPYRKAVLRQQLLFAQRSGTIEIPSFSVKARINRSFFNPGSEVDASSYTLEVEVLPLPAGAPADFRGAVGEYSFSGKVGKTELQANDAIDLSLLLRGKGNLKLVKPPVIDFPTDFEVYDPEVKDRIALNAGGMSGSRTYEYLVIPRYPGKYEIPKITYSWFSPSKEKYVTESAGPFTIEVSGEDGAVPEGPGAIARSRVEPTHRDIRFIITDAGELRPKGVQFFKSAGYYALTAGPLLILLLIVLFHKNRESLLGDVRTMRRKKAHREAKKRLKAAEAAKQVGDSMAFYSEIFNAMYGFLADKLGLEKAALTKPLIKQRMAEEGIDQAVVTETLELIETCEMARFAPVGNESDEAFYQRTSQCIEKLENHFK